MGKLLKIILATIGVLVFLILIIVLTAPLLVNPNNFKPEIIAAVKNRTGRDLILDGDLKLTFFPLPGISTGKMTLNNARGFESSAFASVATSEIKVKFLPLFSKKIEVSQIILNGLVLNLTRNQQGVNNWGDLGMLDKNNTTQLTTEQKAVLATGAIAIKQNEHYPFFVLTAFAVNGLNIENAQIHWQNQQTGKNIVADNFKLNVDGSVFDKPIAIDVSMLLKNIETRETANITFKSHTLINNNIGEYVLDQSTMQIQLGSENATFKSISALLTADKIAVDRFKQTLKISGLKVNTGNVALTAEINGSSFIDKPLFQGSVAVASFNPVMFMKAHSIEPNHTTDDNALSKLDFGFDFTASDNSADLQNLQITLDDTHIKGFGSINDFAKPAISFNLNLDSIDIDRYLPPGTAAIATSPAAALAMTASVLPVAFVKELNVNGELKTGLIKIKKLNLQDAWLKLNAKEGLLTTEQSVKQFHQGSYSGKFSFDVNKTKPLLSAEEKVSHVDIESLLESFKTNAIVTGILDADVHLQGEGSNREEIQASLNGSGNFLCKNGAIKGFNLQQLIDNGKALMGATVGHGDGKNPQTNFEEFSGKAVFKDKEMQNDELLIKTSKLRLTGNGSTNLSTEQIDYQLKAQLINPVTTTTEAEQYFSPLMEIKVTGTYNQPAFKLHVANLLNDENKAKIDKLLDKLDKKAPGLGGLLKKLF